MNNYESLVALSTFVPFGPVRIKLLLEYFGSAKKTWLASTSKLSNLGLSDKIVASFIKHRTSFNQSEYFNKLEKLGINALVLEGKDYPATLKEISNAPFVLYVKGKILPKDKNAVAIVGSRKMSSYGSEVVNQFSSELASVGVTIVSGLARGIDTVAHRGALNVSGRTIAVIGSGLDKIYPPENITLAEKIFQSGSAVISEYPLGYPALPHNFASRNRIISGLSRAVVVVEGRHKSGTLLTASAAAEQGREVFAIPGQITSPLSEAPLFLLQNGAKMAILPKDILNELDMSLKVNSDEVAKVLPSSKDEEIILQTLEIESLHIDEIARASALAVADISARLSIMEIKGMVKNLGSGVYRKI